MCRQLKSVEAVEEHADAESGVCGLYYARLDSHREVNDSNSPLPGSMLALRILKILLK